MVCGGSISNMTEQGPFFIPCSFVLQIFKASETGAFQGIRVCDHWQIIVLDTIMWLYSIPALLQPNNKKRRMDNIFLWLNGTRWSSSSIAWPPLKSDWLKFRKKRNGKDAAQASLSKGEMGHFPQERLLSDLGS